MNKVLVLMSTYNGEKYIKEQIQTIFNQKDVKVKLLIRDDGSKDQTINIISELQKDYDIELESGKNIGFANSFMSLLYKSIEFKDYNYVSFSDQDDIWLPEKINSAIKLIKSVNSDNRKTLYFSAAKAVNEKLEEIFNFASYKNYTYSTETALLRNNILGCTMVMTKELVEFLYNNKPINPITMHDFWIGQVAAIFGNVVYDSQPYILYRQHGNNVAGVSNSFKVRIRRTLISFTDPVKKRYREEYAKNLLATFKNQLSIKDKQLIEMIAFYRNSLNKRMKLIFSNSFKTSDKYSNLLLKIRILLGYL